MQTPRMKPCSTTRARMAVRACCAASLAGFLAACATVAPPPLQETDDQALQQLRTGQAALDCTQACAGAWRHNRADLTARYNQGDWRDLALLVMQIDYRQDLGYFYLGRAAEGLGETSAALDYYKTAEALATGTDEKAKCAASSGDCNGLNLLSEVLTRTQIATAERHRRAWAARGRPGSAEPAAASGQAPAGAWINPPPVSQ
jgi:hypothetical protein